MAEAAIDIKALKDMEADLVKTQELLQEHIEKSNGQIAENGDATTEVKSALDKLSEQAIEFTDKCSELEQKLNDAWGKGAEQLQDIGSMVLQSDQFKAYLGKTTEKAHIDLERGFFDTKAALINATGQNQPLVPSDRLAGIIHEPNRVLRMRDVLAVGTTGSNLIEYAKENVFTNSAGPQVGGSPEQFENVTKPESGITFTLATEPVTTLAHWIPVSKQVLADSPALQTYINTRMIYGLKLKEDTQILLGTSINGELSGLYTGRTAYVMDSPLSYTTKLDVLRDAMTQTHTSEYLPTAIVLNPTDWADIELSKDSQGRYMFANPQTAAAPRLWGLSVVVTNSIAAGTFLVGAFDMAAMLWDREQATIEIGLNSDNFVKNMVTILAEERLALTIFRAAGLVGGVFAVT